ncbi:alpha-D-ribose 1-methylphosphonate 5-triphosphate diphosphatase [Dichotomicrobium thermohalophilum]|uniref:alpha-D-ribose 1-methylphosphonate 5-triphosphate diphosphatase n=1 Tax=Dichotomicrobium thermohalophilum TaxID=933063 RepID=UPI00315CA3C4
MTNARVVLRNSVIEGSVVLRDGAIRAVDDSPSHLPGAEDFEGDLLLPGLVELHSDNLERHVMPRPGTQWPVDAAVLNHDREMTAFGVTTVCNALSVGEVHSQAMRLALLEEMASGLDRQIAAGTLKADHHLHWRCELSYGGLLELLEPLLEHSRLRILSLMDHTPGQRQFTDEERYATYYQGKFNMSDADLAAFIAERKSDQQRYSQRNRAQTVRWAHERGLVLASHDDATLAHVAEAAADGVAVAEFPTTLEAARAAHEAGQAVLMGGPNIVRGGSHSGNVNALELAEAGTLDVLSGDYVPAALGHAMLLLPRLCEQISLPQAVAMATRNPARAIGLEDRGEIAAGQRADLVRVHDRDGMPGVRAVWCVGERIA